MEQFQGPNGSVEFSHKAVEALYGAWLRLAMRHEETDQPTLEWLNAQLDQEGPRAFSLAPVTPELARPEALGYLWRLLTDTLQAMDPPDEEIWQYDVVWEEDRRQEWRSKLERLRDMVAAAAVHR